MDLVAIILLKITTASVYLYAGYQNIRNKESWHWTWSHTALLFYKQAYQPSERFIKVLAGLGISIMFIGSLSLLFGIEQRAGASLLFIFSLLGLIIHQHEKEIALDIATQSDNTSTEFTTVSWSAVSGHISSGLKNIALMGICAYFMFSNQGHSIDYIGKFILGGIA